MVRLIFVNRFYWPELPATGQLLTDLARACARHGFDVRVITSAPTGSSRSSIEVNEGVQITRVRSARTGRRSVAGKAVDFATFFAAATLELSRVLRRGDIVVTMTDPPLLGVATSFLARVKGAHSVHWIQDIYPDVAIAVTGHNWLRGLASFRNMAWRDADQCVTISREMAAVLNEAGVAQSRAHIVPNWPPLGLHANMADSARVQRFRSEWGGDNAFIVAYSGNLGRVHDLQPIIETAELLRHETQFRFVFVGTGAQAHSLAQEVKRRQLQNVLFVAAQPREELAASLSAADLHLVTLRPGCERFVFPSKLYGIAAVARPILFVGPPTCEVGRTVTDRGMGTSVSPDNIAGIADAIRSFESNRQYRSSCAAAAAAFAEDNSFSAAARKWCDILSGTGNGSPSQAQPRNSLP